MKLGLPLTSVNRDYRIVPIKRRLAVLASGGLDSSVMLAELARGGREIFPVYMRAGLMWERHELGALKLHPTAQNARHPRGKRAAIADGRRGRRPLEHDRAQSAGLSRGGVVELHPGAQLELLAKAAIFCAYNRIGEIAMAPLESNPFPDARPEFFRALERAIDLGVGLRLKILTPFVGMTKGEVIRRGANLPLRFTVTCARTKGIVHCGRCTNARSGSRAFAKPEFQTPPNTRAGRRGGLILTQPREPARARSGPYKAAPVRRNA